MELSKTIAKDLLGIGTHPSVEPAPERAGPEIG